MADNDDDYEPQEGDEEEDDERDIKRRRQYPAVFKQSIWDALQAAKEEDKYPIGTMAALSKQFNVHRRVIQGVRDKGEAGLEDGNINFSDKRRDNGRVLKHDPVELKRRLRQLPLESRGTNRDSAHGIGIPTTTFWEYKTKHKIFRTVTATMRPKLTAEHKQARIDFARAKISPVLGEGGRQFYDGQFDTIHIDEKNFHVDKKTRRVFVGDDEPAPNRSCRNINFIQKVMFLAAVARPWRHEVRTLENENDWFWDGKVGMYPLVEERFARRGDVRTGLQRGDRILTPVNIDAAYFESIIIEKLLPDIALKCPATMIQKRIKIQLDNATPHIVNQRRFYDKCDEIGIDAVLVYQPAQSPDFNINDLSFFAAIQSLYYKVPGVNNVIACCNAVQASFEAFDPNKLNRAFLSLFMNYNMVLQNQGSNQYRIPHMGKERLEREGILPTTIEVHDFVVPDDIIEEQINENEVFELVDNNFDGVFEFGDVEE
jgi:hypothetical protein